MKRREVQYRRWALVCGIFGGFLLSIPAWSDPAPQAVCDALVSGADQLYLVDPSGKVMAKFAAAASVRHDPSVSPDGSKVAYLIPAGNDSDIEVVNAAGRTAVFHHRDPKRDSLEDPFLDDGPLMEVTWSSDDVLELTKHGSPSASAFEFRRVSGDLGSADGIGQPGIGGACAMQPGQGQTACVDTGGVDLAGKGIFTVSDFDGISPSASITVTKGTITPMPGQPGYTVQVVGFDKDTIGLRVTNPAGNWSEEYLPAGAYQADTWHFVTYGFSATLVDAKTGTVRVDEVVAGEEPGEFDWAIAWASGGQGLFTVYRRDGKAVLYLIEPRASGTAQAGDDLWQLAAQAPLDISEELRNLRAISPSLLLLRTRHDGYALLSIQLSRSTTGNTTLSLGPVVSLPGTMDIALDGRSEPGKVLDWSCKPAP